jgi:MGT family glycosyltransferase
VKPAASVVVFGTRENGHTKHLLPIISGLARAGIRAHVFSMPVYRDEIENAGGIYLDLFRGRPFEEADAHSIPFPCRYVSFAGRYADQIIAEAAALKPSLVLHDVFAVIGVVVARHLGIPRVNVFAGHNYPPESFLEDLRHDPRVNISEDCWHSVKMLREKYGMPDASPFSYGTHRSTDLNLYCEPPQFLSEDERQPYQPVAFIGSLSDQIIGRAPSTASPYGEGAAKKLRMYVSFGTIIWRYYQDAARSTLEAIREAIEDLPEFAVLASLGRAEPGDWVWRLVSPGFRVESYVNQWDVLAASSVYITHHGLNSTHEAIFQKVPMISYPFFSDQPVMAKFCQDKGLAIPLATELRGRVLAKDVRRALSSIADRRERMMASLSEARQWELDVIAGRSRVIQRILNLIP